MPDTRQNVFQYGVGMQGACSTQPTIVMFRDRGSVSWFNADGTYLKFRGLRNWVVAGAGKNIHRHVAEAETGEYRSTAGSDWWISP